LLQVSRQPNGQPEIFYSIQGEGVNVGIPAVFLRLALCNLRCSWCDTRYTWDWEQYDRDKEIIKMSLEEIEGSIIKHNCNHLVITGGEPLVQHRQLMPLLKSLKNKGFYIEIETNGTIVPDVQVGRLIDQWNVSPKIENSGNSLSCREILEAYEFFRDLTSTYFKYVIQREDDVTEVQRIIDKYNISQDKVILMPEARDRETLLQRGQWLAELCKDKGYKFSNRLQVFLWDGKRGA